MVQIEGKYSHEKNENLDEYFRVTGVPYVARKMMCSSSPSLEIKNNEETWTITVATLFRTNTTKFKLGEEYEEHMPGGTLKNTTVLEGDNKLITKSLGPNNTCVTRTYDFSDKGCVITYKHDDTGTIGKRYFTRN